MNLMQHSYHDNHDNVLHYCDIGILIIAQPYIQGWPGLYNGLCTLVMECGVDQSDKLSILNSDSGSVPPNTLHCPYS